MKKEISLSLTPETLAALDDFVLEQKKDGAKVNRSSVIERAIKDQLAIFAKKSNVIVLG